jgi:site-specific DNA-cytosine methylase
MARRLDNQPSVAESQRVGNFELYDFPTDAVSPALNASRARDLMAYGSKVEAVIQDTREMADKKQNGSGVSTKDISYTLTTLDRPAVFRKSARAQSAEHSETWIDDGIANTLNAFDTGDVRTTHAVIGGGLSDDDLLPLGIDSHRYRCCGNGVAAPVAEWIGRRIVEVDRRWRQEAR